MSRRVGVALMSIIFLVTLVSALPVEAKVPLRWEANCGYTFEPEWTGVIETEDGQTGTIIFDVVEWRLVGIVEQDSIVWRINWDDGEYIEGTLEGCLVLSTLAFIYNGQVTDASADWSHLVGRNVHVTGSVDLSYWTAHVFFQIN